MGKMSTAQLFYELGGVFAKNVEKVERTLDKKLPFSEKVAFIKKNGPALKPKVAKITKSLDDAMKFKEEGNKLFKGNSQQDAKDMYTKALMYWPINENDLKSNKDYAIILANRSAALEKLRCHEGVAEDIDLALKYGYPRELYFKVYNRKGSALFHRKLFKDSKATFQLCKDFIGKSDMKTQERERWRIKMAKQFSVFNSAKGGVENKAFPPRPWSQQVEDASKLEIRDKVTKVTKDVNIEEIVHHETPFAAAIEGLFGTEELRDKANATFHKYEYKTLESWKELGLSAYAKLAYRLVTMIPKDQVSKIAKNLDKKSEAEVSEIEQIFNLPVTQHSSADAMTYAYLVYFLVMCLEEHQYFDNKVTQDDVINVLQRAILISAQYGQRVSFGDPPYDESSLWNLKTFPTKPYAVAIYPKFAQLKNASSNTGYGSDVVVFFQDDRIMVQSFRKLKEGQSIDLHFDTEIKPDNNDMINYKCSAANCELAFPLKKKTSEKIVKCPLENCGAETNIWKALKRIVELRRDHETARKEAESKKLQSAICIIGDIVAEWETMVYRPARELTKMENDLKKLILMNNEQMEREYLYNTR